MDKTTFIKNLAESAHLTTEQSTLVNNILEGHFIVGKNNKEKIISKLREQLNIADEEAEKIYESAMSLIGGGIKDKLKHPFGSQD